MPSFEQFPEVYLVALPLYMFVAGVLVGGLGVEYAHWKENRKKKG